jgi:glycosyltransferase involved in cell wall biosynthesis
MVAYNKMNAIICVSDFTLQMFQQKFPGLNSKLKVIYNPVDSIRIERLSNDFLIERKSKFTIVSVGRLTVQKRFDRLIRVAARFRKENYDLTVQIIGDGELKEDLKNLSKKLETDDITEFVGFVNNPFPFIKNADLMVLPSASEGFGLVVVEAMALGIPVIATRTAGPTEILEENKYGLLSEHDDESIYQAIKKLIKDDALREYYRKLGLERSKDFNVNKTMRAFDNLLETII